MSFEVKSELQTAQLAEETAMSGTGESADVEAMEVADVEAMEVADVVKNMILQIEKHEHEESKTPVLKFSRPMTGRKSSCPKSDSTARGGKVYLALKRSHPCGQAPLSVAVARKSSCADRTLQVSRRRGRPRALRTSAPGRTRSRGRPRIRNTFVPVEVPGSDGASPQPPVLQPYSLKRGPLLRRRPSRRGSVSGFITSRGRVPSHYFNNDAIAEQFYYDYSCLPGLASRWSFERVSKHSFNVNYIGDSRFVVRNRSSACSVGEANSSSLSVELPRYNAAGDSGSAASSINCMSFRLPAVLAPREFVLVREQKMKQLRLLKEWEMAMNRICARDGVAQLAVENKVDLTLPPNEFKFVTQSVSEVSVPMLETVPIGCSCKNCLLEWGSCCPSHTSIGQFAYDRYRRLRIGNCQPIFECGLLCKCDVSCVNRVVQNGRQYKVCIFRTKNNGWGVKAAEFIPQNSYVMEYVGEIITDAEAERRGAIYDDLGETYLFDLDYLETTKFSIDAKFYGNEARFCEPNMRVHNVWINNYHLSMPRLAFFTIKDVGPGEELTLNYYMHNDIPSNSKEVAQHMKIIPCLCGSKNCKRTLYVKLHGSSPNKQRMIAEGSAHNPEPASTSKQAEMESGNNKHATVPCDATQVHN
ncbi:Histone-lysine N-methyltransferase SUV39H1 [Trichinella pseudospiralis]|uniref:Histone-lysine N-methyltransferase SUV39H1 n=1 Tax=Trichinella pseudospiralis TaxID=6337 RepID=A0A0V1E2R1_TRIPS|nr:Histone-lysine N-methyltransferase SUV39H1 [Trichinella pseudospiralis]KRZ34035.1 Histone-lysine N-methyltransferase SUV39H1 [Trichinella pseudospiralis]